MLKSMLPLEFTARVVNLKAVKDMKVAATTAEQNDDICPMVEGSRAGRPVAMFAAPEVDRDLGLRAVQVCAVALECDEVWMMSDSHVSHEAINPFTSKPWAPGEMQTACDNEGACSLGLITDCLAICGRTRDGREYFISVPYHVHKTGRTVRWIEDQVQWSDSASGDGHVEGLVIDAFRWAFEQPGMTEKMRQMGVDPAQFGDTEVARAHQDIAVFEMMTRRGFECMVYAPKNAEAVKVFERTYGENAARDDLVDLEAELR